MRKLIYILIILAVPLYIISQSIHFGSVAVVTFYIGTALSYDKDIADKIDDLTTQFLSTAWSYLMIKPADATCVIIADK